MNLHAMDATVAAIHRRLPTEIAEEPLFTLYVYSPLEPHLCCTRLTVSDRERTTQTFLDVSLLATKLPALICLKYFLSHITATALSTNTAISRTPYQRKRTCRVSLPLLNVR